MAFTSEGPIQLFARKDFFRSPYGYIPTESTAITYIVLFGVATIVHLFNSFRYRQWWLLPTMVFCGCLEIAGWGGRLWSSISPRLGTPFELQITATIVGPTPLLAANFIILGVIIGKLGVQYSRLGPRLYTIIFCASDLVSLVIQGLGGAKAAVAVNTGFDPNPGARIMLAGIGFQLAVISIYALCAIEFYVRFAYDRPVRALPQTEGQTFAGGPQKGVMTLSLKLVSGGLFFSTLCLFIRAIYRTIELRDGWGGRIITTQVYFDVLDGAMVVLAFYTFFFIPPRLLLKDNQYVDSVELKAPRANSDA